MCLVAGNAGALLLGILPAQTNRPSWGRFELHHLLFDVLTLKDGPRPVGRRAFHGPVARMPGLTEVGGVRPLPLNRSGHGSTECVQRRNGSRGRHARIRPASGVVIAFAARVTTPLRLLVTRAAYRRGTRRARAGLARTGARTSTALGDWGALATPILSRLAVLALQPPQVACRYAQAFDCPDYRSAYVGCRQAHRMVRR